MYNFASKIQTELENSKKFLTENFDDIQWDNAIAEKVYQEVQQRSFLLRSLPVIKGTQQQTDLKYQLAIYFDLRSSSLFQWFYFPSEGPVAQATLTFATQEFCDQAKEKLKNSPRFEFIMAGQKKLLSFLSWNNETVPHRSALNDSLGHAMKTALKYSSNNNNRNLPIRPSGGQREDPRETLAKSLDKFVQDLEQKKKFCADPSNGSWKELKSNNSVRFEYFSPKIQKGVSQIEGRIGKGSESTVFIGRRSSHNKDNNDPEYVAVKQFYPNLDYSPADADILANIHKKGSTRTVRSIQYIAAESEGESNYLILELCPADLSSIKDLKPAEARWIITELCKAVKTLHQAGIVHRDLRPSNILITERGDIKIADFGFSRQIKDDHMSTLITGQELQPYEVKVIHEQRKKVSIDKSCDIFMLGMCICYVASKGYFPFGDGSYGSQHKAIIDKESPTKFMDRHVPDMFLRSLLENLLSHESSERFAIEDVLAHPYFWSYAERESKIKHLYQLSEDPDYEKVLNMSCPELNTWRRNVPPNILNAVKNSKSKPSEIANLLAFVRHGLEHSKDWLYAAQSEAMKEGKGSSVNEFFFNHPSVAWLLPKIVIHSVKASQTARRTVDLCGQIASRTNDTDY